ncbi:MAG: DUF4143 domain-containing protein, partial [Desulfobacterales bacterium]|nr:DUF4143 domain-containing protein [Desulfobacterales bacterium]
DAGHLGEETTHIFLGGYPELHLRAEADLWFSAYVATYLERDVRNILRVIDLQDFNRFIRACALRTSQVINYSDLARDTGIAPNTARKWTGLLQTSAIISLVEPYFGNRTKRLIKSPKLFFLDTGLAAFLSGFRSQEDLFASSLAGAFWETHVFGQIIKHAASRGNSSPVNFWRTANGPEVDLVMEQAGGTVMAIECKFKERPDNSDAAGLRALADAEKGRIRKRVIVCRTKVTYKLSDETLIVNPLELLNNI